MTTSSPPAQGGETPTPDVTVAAPGIFAQGSPEAHFEGVLACLPPVVTALSQEAQEAWGISPETMVAACLHQLAAALGAACSVSVPSGNVAPAFNVMVVTPESVRSSWVDRLGEPWLMHMRKHEAEFARKGAAQLRKEWDRLQQIVMHPSQHGGPEAFTDATRQLSLLKLTRAPCVEAHSADPDCLERSVRQSFDRCVLSHLSDLDAAREILHLGAKGMRKLADMLERSWRDKPLVSAQAPSLRGLVHAFWCAERQGARKLLIGRTAAWGAQPPPLLLLREDIRPSFLAGTGGEHLVCWAALLVQCLAGRTSARPADALGISPGAAEVLEKFDQELNARLERIPAFLKRHFRWMTEMVARVALLLTILRHLRDDNGLPGADACIEVEEMTQAVHTVWWLAERHYQTLNWLLAGDMGREGDPGDTDAADNTDGTDTPELEAEILERLRSKGPISQRDLLRSFHKMRAGVLRRIVERLKRRDLVREMADGRVVLQRETAIC